ncbi:efflux RND transporter periplasmic adaptor subunit [Roseiconus lacunae]|uniref:efflux RND transporter periplasmic adaptor subunit n=1 Tax=Roseiconus lacunae TaxID=2605694 RepID=UPI001E2D0638|nr:HlyD family efflux transporter periplasmic adaptor subunit [Roseiconus lacunae]MCD0458689.1 biotin/lipoyl-binding protein [Roseiconus lacunae]
MTSSNSKDTLLTSGSDALLTQCDTYLDQGVPLTQAVNGMLAEVVHFLRLEGAFGLYVSGDGNMQMPFRSGADFLPTEAVLEWCQSERRAVQLAMARDNVVVRKAADDSIMSGFSTAYLQFGYEGAAYGVIQLLYVEGDVANEHVRAETLRVLCHCVGRLVVEYKRFSAEPTRFWRRFNQFVSEIQRGLDLTRVAAAVCNDGAALLDVDRVTLAVLRRGQCRVVGISGHSRLQHRSRVVASLQTISRSVIQAGLPIHFAGQYEPRSTDIETALAEHLSHSGTRLLIALPIFQLPGSNEASDRTPSGRQAIACLIVEQFAVSRPSPRLEPRLELIETHIANAVANSLTYNQLFLLPVWKWLGQSLNVRRGPSFRAILCLLTLATMVLLAFIPVEYHVWASGRIMPTRRASIFAPAAAEVKKILVDDGQHVTKEQPLVQLTSDDLQTRRIVKENELSELEKRAVILRSRLGQATDLKARDQFLEVEGELARTRIAVDGVRSELQLLAEEFDKLQVRSPIAGVVTTFNVRQKLSNRPVSRGELLLEVMNEDLGWELELDIPAYRMGHVRRASDGGEPVPLQFALANAVDTVRSGFLLRTGTRLEAASSGEAVVRVIASVDEKGVDAPVGTEVTAKIRCGERSALYTLFGDVYEFIRRYVWW